MTWAVFVGRRRLNVDAFLATHRLRSYSSLCAWCDSNNVIPPAREDTKGMFGPRKVAPAVPKAPPKAAPETPAKAPAKKKRAPKVVAKPPDPSGDAKE